MWISRAIWRNPSQWNKPGRAGHKQGAERAMNPPGLVIFDCDGVLVDTEGPTNEILAKDLSERGLPISADECMALFVGGTIYGVGVRARELGAAIPDDWVDVIYAKIYARLREGIAPIPGVEDVLERLDTAGVPYCVGSNGAPEKMEITLGQTGLFERMRGKLFSPHVIGMEHAKPNPGLYLHAARSMGFDPHDCMVIEDSVSGATGARAAGIRCFGYGPQADVEGLRAVGAQVFFDMAELPGLLGL